ncbi:MULTISPECIES: thiamine diphosphokinase [Aerococcus]|uniref:Thiamine diphosphokinase n=1 Tax=Aerococcus sanguinicola TaxID=119206 RepID=A0A5N1GKH8_9LACT|nr:MULTISPECIES: thiamine diphosphokinase [Aerococcus]KAA9300798.1 thiamine diphosphokinase [Aerococcus sanguinicola]MDK6369415.1 thiamine diphosphokinase [Aerococcus sp. UMB9870]MDK6680478.1 thiamine diphosphokinase [Aerococcus sp. UMB8608]MDK6686722.1 thiamine diphosphokinase [Aerococcus sp. UMB8623]MDK6940425.1 thiamine diphosphokinase [Aerococcus sp. UMB8487]
MGEKQALLVGSGDLEDKWLDRLDLGPDDFCLGVDKGALRLLQAGLPLDLALGDFDSVSAQEKAWIQSEAKQVVELPAMKDATDLEEALDYLLAINWQGQVRCLGFLGGRLDHTLSVVWLGYEDRYQDLLERLTFEDPYNSLGFLLPGDHQVDRQPDKVYLSFIGLGPVADLSLDQVLYPLDHYQMTVPRAFISNEFLPDADQMNLCFTSGRLLVIQSRDAWR